MEHEISPSEQKMKSILQNAPVGLIETDEGGRIVNINRIGSILVNSIASETLLPGASLYPFLDILNPEIAIRMRRFLEPEGLILHNQHYHLMNHAADRKHFQLTVTKISVQCLILSLADITEKIQEEQALRQALQDKAVAQGKYEIASEVIHDIGNAVVGFGSYLTRIHRMLEQYNPGNLQKVATFLKQQRQPVSSAIGEAKATALIDMVEAISRSLSDSHDELSRSVNEQLHLITHVQDILNIQRQYVSGRESVERKPVNLKDIIYDCRSMLLASLEKKGINLVLNILSAPVEIKADRTKLMQVLLNILKNSIEAIDETTTEKTINIVTSDTEDTLNLVVTDTGIGFDEQTAEHLFDRGYSTKNTGTGLGLYNCKTIIESHAGSIAIESDGIGTGSKTILTFKRESTPKF